MICKIVWKVSEVETLLVMETVKGELLVVVLVLGLEILMNHIGLNDEDTMGCSFGSFDGMTYEKPREFIARKYFEEKNNPSYIHH